MTPVKPEELLPELVVCSAARNPITNEVFISLRHGDSLFWAHFDARFSCDAACLDFEQGFITNRQRFVTREEAYEIALENNQIRRASPTAAKRLYSEMLY